MLCCPHVSRYVCVFREKYGAITAGSHWSVNVADAEAYTILASQGLPPCAGTLAGEDGIHIPYKLIYCTGHVLCTCNLYTYFFVTSNPTIFIFRELSNSTSIKFSILLHSVFLFLAHWCGPGRSLWILLTKHPVLGGWHFLAWLLVSKSGPASLAPVSIQCKRLGLLCDGITSCHDLVNLIVAVCEEREESEFWHHATCAYHILKLNVEMASVVPYVHRYLFARFYRYHCEL